MLKNRLRLVKTLIFYLKHKCLTKNTIKSCKKNELQYYKIIINF